MIPTGNIFAEPAKRDTAPAVALGIGLIAARNPNAVMMVLPADQLIQDTAAFQAVMRDALNHRRIFRRTGHHRHPTHLAMSVLRLHRARRSRRHPRPHCDHPAFEVKCFREKPSPELAEEFLRQGGFSWNAGMFVWSLPTVIRQLATTRRNSRSSSRLRLLRYLTTIAAIFPTLPARSIDYALMENADRVLNIEATFDWDDVGSWIFNRQIPSQPTAAKTTPTKRSPSSIASNNIVFNARPAFPHRPARRG
jgi:mannose-1-phosphate guanylyltransferase